MKKHIVYCKRCSVVQLSPLPEDYCFVCKSTQEMIRLDQQNTNDTDKANDPGFARLVAYGLIDEAGNRL